MGGRSRLLSEGDAVGEALKLIAAEDFGIDHADEQRLDRALAEPVNNPFDCPPGNPVPRFRGTVEKSSVLERMFEVAFLFQATENRAYRGVLERAAQFFARLLGGQFPHTPDDLENAALQFPQLCRIVTQWCVTVQNVTECNTEEW